MPLPHISPDNQPDHITTALDVDNATMSFVLHVGACLERLPIALDQARDVMTNHAYKLLVHNVMTLLEWRTTDEDNAMTI